MTKILTFLLAVLGVAFVFIASIWTIVHLVVYLAPPVKVIVL